MRRRLRRRQDLPRLIGAADMKRAWHRGIAPALSLSAALVHAQATPQIAPPPVPAPPTVAPVPGAAAPAPIAAPAPAGVPATPSGPPLTLHDAVQSTLRLHPAIALS